MPDPATARPFTTFNFRVRIPVDENQLCEAAFSECDGLEMTMEPKTHREGGNNVTQYQLVGPMTYGQLTLKRGMTETFDLWDWFNRVNEGEYSLRTKVVVEILSSEWSGEEQITSSVDARFTLAGCLPVKLRAPSLNASDGGVAIEELQIAYERMDTEIPNSPSG
jgi:phage tail-like protein